MNSSIKQITMSGVLSGLAILFGVFVHFPLFGGNVYLIGLITFLFPIILKFNFSIIATIISVVLTDVITGFGQYSWISAIAYGSSSIILFLFSKLKIKAAYIFGSIFASFSIIIVYFFLEWSVFGLSLSIKDTTATSLQMLIIVLGISFIYKPIKMITKPLV